MKAHLSAPQEIIGTTVTPKSGPRLRVQDMYPTADTLKNGVGDVRREVAKNGLPAGVLTHEIDEAKARMAQTD